MRPTSPLLIALSMFLLTSALSSAPVLAAEMLVLPVDGPGSDRLVRDDVEVTIRRALTSLPNQKVQRRERTAVMLEDASAGGLVCVLTEPLCAARIGVIAGVDQVLIAILEEEAEALRLTLIDVATGHVLAFARQPIELPSHDGGQSVAALTHRVARPEALIDVTTPNGVLIIVDGIAAGLSPLPGPLALSPGRHTLGVAPTDAPQRITRRVLELNRGDEQEIFLAPEPVVVKHAAAAAAPAETQSMDEGLPGGFIGGVALSSIGAVLAAAAGAGALVIESQLSTPQRGESRQSVEQQQTLGVGLLLASGVGLVTLAAGAGLAALAPTTPSTVGELP